MKIEGKQELIRIFVNEADEWDGRPLYKAIVEEARLLGYAGCTVVRGIEGFGSSGQVHDARFEPLYLDLPVIVEIVDQTSRIKSLMPILDKMIKVGMVTLEKVDVEAYRAKEPTTPAKQKKKNR